MRRGAQGALSWDKVKGGACTGTPSFPPGPIKPYYQAQPAWWCPSSANGFISIVPSETRPTAQAQSQECPFSQGAPTSCKPGSCGEASTGRPPTPRGQSQALGALDWPSWRRGSCLAHPQPTGKYLVCIRGGRGARPLQTPQGLLSLGLQPEDLGDTLLPDGGTAGRARPSRGL